MGEVTTATAEQTGLAAGTPVVVGGADTQLGLIGIGVVQPGTMTLLGGSFWQLTLVTDEPLIDPDLIDRCVEALSEDPEAPMATLVHPAGPEAGADPNRVKAVVDARGRALYFSRSPIPAWRGEAASQPKAPFLQHIGLYAYRREFLLEFVGLPQTPLERAERLEQLRVLEHGYRIMTTETERDPIGVDTPADLERVRRLVAAGVPA